MIDYLKIGKANELEGGDRKLYRALEILPGALSWLTLILLLVFSYFDPVWVAFFIIAFDVYWLLLVLFLGIHLVASYRNMKRNLVIDWRGRCGRLDPEAATGHFTCSDIIHLIIFPTYEEDIEIIRASFQALVNDGFPAKNMIVVLATEARAGAEAAERARIIEREYARHFRHFLVTVHPDDIVGELKGKGANQSWAAREVKREIIDKFSYDYDKILVSVFDMDTVVAPGYFYRFTYRFLTAPHPYRASYQPIPVYQNNLWQAPFFARVAASSNTFWQMMQQVREEKLATYSSHSMTWRSLVDIGFWSTSMVSEDSRIFWHCLLYYRGDYRVEPLYYPVSMDICMDKNWWITAKNLYRQQQRWGWGVENIPYLMFNTIKYRRELPLGKFISRILVQINGFHSWATNAHIIAVVGWMPLLLGGNRFNATVLSGNLPSITRTLMTIAMVGLVMSAVISTLLLPKDPQHRGFFKTIWMALEWLVLPVSIVIFGAIPGMDAQTRLMRGKYLGFLVTPKSR